MRTTKILGVIALLAVLAPGRALAEARFTSTSGSILNTGPDAGDLIVRFTESGLVPNAPVNYSLTGTNTATYACLIGAHATPMAPYTTNITFEFTLPATSRGIVSQTVDFEESTPQETCGAGARIILYRVEYNNVYINDGTNDVHEMVSSGHFTFTFCNLNKNPKNCPSPSSP